MPRKNFAFRFAWSEAIADLRWPVRLEVFEATVRYAETGQTGELSPEAAEAFEKHILPDFRRRQKAAEYRARRKARLAAEAAAKASEQVIELSSRPALASGRCVDRSEPIAVHAAITTYPAIAPPYRKFS